MAESVSPNDATAALAAAVALYREMLGHARAEDWDAVLNLGDRRGALMATVANAPLDSTHRAALETLNGLNEALSQHLAPGREDALVALQTFRRRHRAHEAYGQDRPVTA